MDKKKIFIPGAPPPIGPYSPALLINNTLYVSGQVPVNIETGKLITENIELATHQVLRNIKVLLAEADMTLENVVKCSIFMTDLNEFQKMNVVYAGYFEGISPARETVEISRLPMDATIEISCIAIK